VTRWYAAATDIEERKQAEQRLQNENVALRDEIDQVSMFEEIVGSSKDNSGKSFAGRESRRDGLHGSDPW